MRRVSYAERLRLEAALSVGEKPGDERRANQSLRSGWCAGCCTDRRSHVNSTTRRRAGEIDGDDERDR